MPQVPEGDLRIAQRFNVGFNVRKMRNLDGTDEVRIMSVQPSLRDASNCTFIPTLKRWDKVQHGSRP